MRGGAGRGAPRMEEGWGGWGGGRVAMLPKGKSEGGREVTTGRILLGG